MIQPGLYNWLFLPADLSQPDKYKNLLNSTQRNVATFNGIRKIFRTNQAVKQLSNEAVKGRLQ